MRVEPAAALVGHIAVPGDKSISHRAVLIGAVGEGETRVERFGRSADTESTIAAVRSLGVDVSEEDVDTLLVQGVGLRGLADAATPVDCGNAGTLMRLLAGVEAPKAGRRVVRAIAFEYDQRTGGSVGQFVEEISQRRGVENGGVQEGCEIAQGSVSHLELLTGLSPAAIITRALHTTGDFGLIAEAAGPTRRHMAYCVRLGLYDLPGSLRARRLGRALGFLDVGRPYGQRPDSL